MPLACSCLASGPRHDPWAVWPCRPLACSKLAAELETTTAYGDWRSRRPQKRETEREEVTSQATTSPWGLGPARERGARGAGAVARRAHSQVRRPWGWGRRVELTPKAELRGSEPDLALGRCPAGRPAAAGAAGGGAGEGAASLRRCVARRAVAASGCGGWGGCGRVGGVGRGVLGFGRGYRCGGLGLLAGRLAGPLPGRLLDRAMPVPCRGPGGRPRRGLVPRAVHRARAVLGPGQNAGPRAGPSGRGLHVHI